MMNDLKMGIKIMRHAYGIKANCIQVAVFALVGLFFALRGDQEGFGLMGVFWICIGIVPTQLIHTLNVANLVQSSPMKKKMQTTVPVMVNLTSMTAVYLVGILLYTILSQIKPEQSIETGGGPIGLALMMAMVLMYLGICYKFFVAATLFLVPTMVFWMRGTLKDWAHVWHLLGDRAIPYGLAVLIGFGILAAGGLAEYLLTVLLYKRPMSKTAQAVPLRKEL